MTRQHGKRDDSAEASPQDTGRIVAPWNVPLRRRIQTFAVFLWIATLPLCVVTGIVCAMYSTAACLSLVERCRRNTGGLFAIPSFETVYQALLVVLCVAYVWGMSTDRRYIKRGGGPWPWLRRSRCVRWLYKHYCDFFPATVVFDNGAEEAFRANFERRAAAGGPGTNYLMTCHPHGFLTCSVWTTFAAPSSEFHKRITEPFGLTHTLHTMTMNFYVPLWREYLLWMGWCDVSKEALINNLNLADPAQSPLPSRGDLRDECSKNRIAVLVPGGASESVDATQPILTLRNRKGFVRIALFTGAALVPVYTFGETELYRPIVRSKKLQRVLHRIERTLGLGTPLVHGRGIFNYAIGLLPYRRKLRTVIGKPIPIPEHMKAGAASSKVNEKDVAELHELYIKELTKLYERHRDPAKDPELQFR